jgi:hypothetical protein
VIFSERLAVLSATEALEPVAMLSELSTREAVEKNLKRLPALGTRKSTVSE